jgi:hypothetical protein
MIPRRILLVLSLVANAVFAAWLVHSVVRPKSAATTGSSEATTESSHGAIASAPIPEPLRDVTTLSPIELRDHLRRLGLPAEIVDSLVKTRIWARHRARFAELRAEALRTTPWWRSRDVASGSLRGFTPAQRKELRDLEAAARDETLTVLGPQALDPDGAIAARYAFVLPAKAVQLDALERDYRNLNAELSEETRSIRTAADSEREKFIETERLRDLDSLLTPAEREMYDLRASKTVSNSLFQSRMAAFEPTEQEFRALAAAQKTFEDKFPLVPMAGMGMVQRARLQDQNDILQQIHSALGDARFAEWQLTNDQSYQLLATYGASIGIPRDATRDLAKLINDAPAASVEISHDRTLSQEQKYAAILALADDVRAKATAQVGADNADRVLSANFAYRRLETGSAVTVTPRGISVQSFGSAPVNPRGAPVPPRP